MLQFLANRFVKLGSECWIFKSSTFGKITKSRPTLFNKPDFQFFKKLFLVIFQAKPDAGTLIIATVALLIASTSSLLIVCQI